MLLSGLTLIILPCAFMFRIVVLRRPWCPSTSFPMRTLGLPPPYHHFSGSINITTIKHCRQTLTMEERSAIQREPSSFTKDLAPYPTFPSSNSRATLEELQTTWTRLYRTKLPSLARSKHPTQPRWPVCLDHCFARIILDAVVRNSTEEEKGVSLCPWTERIDKPAVKHMNLEQLNQCIELGEAIAEGRANLVELDEQSLAARGKSKGKGQKRKMAEPIDDSPPRSKKTKTTKARGHQQDIRTALGLPPTPPKFPSTAVVPTQPPPATISPSLSSKIHLAPTLTPFRRRVLLTLCQVPSGQFTTYLAISDHLHSSPRAVGGALRNNPFAPEVPCHRVVAADGGIGGFGGEWGVEGRHNGKKVGLLRGEGAEVEMGDGRVRGEAWTGFV